MYGKGTNTGLEVIMRRLSMLQMRREGKFLYVYHNVATQCTIRKEQSAVSPHNKYQVVWWRVFLSLLAIILDKHNMRGCSRAHDCQNWSTAILVATIPQKAKESARVPRYDRRRGRIQEVRPCEVHAVRDVRCLEDACMQNEIDIQVFRERQIFILNHRALT